MTTPDTAGPIDAPLVELLHVDGCPHHEALVPHLHQLLAEHGIDARIATIRIENIDDAHRLRFLGSPTLRVNGVDVDPTATARDGYGLQCRLYSTPDGTAGSPSDEWILRALTRPGRDRGGRRRPGR